MITSTETEHTTTKDIIQSTTGIYPLTALGISFFHYCQVDLIICRKDGFTSTLLKQDPVLNIEKDGCINKIDISGRYVNGLLGALHKKTLPSVILCTPPYEYLQDLINEIIEITKELGKRNLLKAQTRLNRFYFPTFILASNGIIYDEFIYNLKIALANNNIPENLIKNICGKIVRGSIMQGAYRENNLYHPLQKGLVKIAVPRYDLFMPVVELLNDKGFQFSIHTNPYKIEFEKALVNIASNAIAFVFALDKHNCQLNKITMQDALMPADPIQLQLTRELQTAVFEIGKKVGAFSETDTFDKIWQPRKEQILKNDSQHVSSSLYCFRDMIENNDFPDGLPGKEHALIHPLKSFALHFNMKDKAKLFEELEVMILNNLTFARKNVSTIALTF